jgi:Tfp pilus assembly protein PilF
LSASESALGLTPDSADARYNFALLLQQGGYAIDAANELEKVLAKYPNDARAHLALANLSAQQLHDDARARLHYQKLLETDPHNPQANDIRRWIAEHP